MLASDSQPQESTRKHLALVTSAELNLLNFVKQPQQPTTVIIEIQLAKGSQRIPCWQSNSGNEYYASCWTVSNSGIGQSWWPKEEYKHHKRKDSSNYNLFAIPLDPAFQSSSFMSMTLKNSKTCESDNLAQPMPFFCTVFSTDYDDAMPC